MSPTPEIKVTIDWTAFIDALNAFSAKLDQVKHVMTVQTEAFRMQTDAMTQFAAATKAHFDEKHAPTAAVKKAKPNHLRLISFPPVLATADVPAPKANEEDETSVE